MILQTDYLQKKIRKRCRLYYPISHVITKYALYVSSTVRILKKLLMNLVKIDRKCYKNYKIRTTLRLHFVPHLIAT